MGMLFVPYWQFVQHKQPISRKRLPIYFSIKLIDVQLKYRYKHFLYFNPARNIEDLNESQLGFLS